MALRSRAWPARGRVRRSSCTAGKMKTETIEYRYYELQATRYPPMWNVGIYPCRPDLPKPNLETAIVALADKEQAMAEAKRRVDVLLSSV